MPETNRINELRAQDVSPEKAGVGGSTPSLATILFNSLRFPIPASWLQLATKLLNSCRGETAQSGDDSSLRGRHELLVNIECRASARMPHLTLRVLRVCPCHLQPHRVRGAKTAPVYPRYSHFPTRWLQIARQDIVVPHRPALLH